MQEDLALLVFWLGLVDLSLHRRYALEIFVDIPSQCRLPRLSVLRTE